MTGKKCGVTLLELMTIVVIIGILAALALPRYHKVVELTKVREAISSLKQIRHGEIVYRGEQNEYWQSQPGPNEMGDIEHFLRVLLDRRDNRNWDYYIRHNVGPTTFTATAEKRSGPYSGETITIDQDGDLDGTWNGPWP